MPISPMMQQYLDVKSRYSDAILMFRVGDFFEMFYDDARTVSAELELTLTGKDCGEEERAPMCGVPYHAADSYINRLVERGHKVVVCDQVEDPALAKGLVKREITRIVTPGTLIDPDAINGGKNNYLAAVAVDGDGCAAAFIDISTGDISAVSLKGMPGIRADRRRLINELDTYKPSELLLEQKHVTAEVTPNHLWFDDRDYAELGNLIKCNPAIKRDEDRIALWAALYDGLIDTIATDHAPHTLASKQQRYFDAPGGIPSIQHSLTMMLEPLMHNSYNADEQREFRDNWLPLFVKLMCHNPATLFGIEGRGFIREGYKADLTLVRPHVDNIINKESLYYKCGWSPLEGQTFHSRVEMTFVNGHIAYEAQSGVRKAENGERKAERLVFNR